MLHRVLSRLVVFAAVLCAITSSANATNVLVPHQGRLLDAGDQPVTGPVDLTFRIFEVPTGGAPLWSETLPGVAVEDGLFAVNLGLISPLDVDVLTPTAMSQERWLEVEVAGTVISPRLRLGSAPAAAIASRISGDLESRLAHLGLLGVDQSSRMELDDFDDSTRIVIAGADGRMIVVKHRLEPHECRLAVGDLDRDGFADIVTTPESSRMLLMDSTGSGSASISNSVNGDLGLQPLGGEILVHGDDGSSSASVSAKVDRAGGTMTGDLAVIAGPSSAALSASLIGSSLHLADDRDLLGLRELNAAVGQDTSKLTLSSDSDGDGIASKNIGLYVSDVTGQSKIECSSDNDDDGVPDQEIVSKITPTIVQHAINTKGTGGNNGRVGIISSTSLDSATIECSSDADGDGNPELLSSRRMINADAKLKAIFLVDVDDDGTPEGEVSTECGATEAKHAINTKGTGGNNGHTKVVSRTFEGGADVDVSADGDGDGHDEAKIVISAQFEDADNAAGCEMGQSLDVDDDGIPDLEISSKITPTMSQHAINTKGTGAQGGLVVSVSSSTNVDSALSEISIDDDGDGTPETSLRDKATPVLGEISITKNLDNATTGLLRMAVTDDSTVLDLGYHGSVSGTLKLQVGSSAANPIEHSSGAHLTAGGVWTNSSDANLKENFRSVDGAELLEKIEELPINQWNYKAESGEVTHIGPTAQDFKKTFGVGADDKTISTIDPSGVALAAIKELYAQLSEMQRREKEQSARLQEGDAQLEALQRELKQLRDEMKKNK